MPHICQNEQWQCAFMKTMEMLKPVLVTTKSWRCSDFQSKISFIFFAKGFLKNIQWSMLSMLTDANMLL